MKNIKRLDLIGNSIIREAIIGLNASEALHIYDEGQEYLDCEAQEEIEDMERKGVFLPEGNER